MLEVWVVGLHPDQVGVWSEGTGSHHGALGATAVAVQALSDSWQVPVEEDVLAEQFLGELLGLAVGGLGQWADLVVELLDDLLLVGDGGLVDLVGEGLVEQLQAGLLDPGGLQLLQLVTGDAGHDGPVHVLGEGLDIWVRGADDEVVVAGVDGGADQRGGLGVGSCDDHQLGVHYVRAHSDGDQSVDVLLDWDDTPAGHVATLLVGGRLVLHVDTGCAALDEHLGQLEDGCEATVACVCVGDDGGHVVDGGSHGVELLL